MESTVSVSAFRAAMGAVVTPVSVVTLFDGIPHGTTVSAFCSLSLDPPMVLISLDRKSDLLSALLPAGRFGLNVLASDQADVATTFATRGIDRFAEVSWSLAGGVPRLEGAASWVACEIASTYDGGDHVIVAGLVTDAGHADRPGLTYQHRTFGRHHVDDVFA